MIIPKHYICYRADAPLDLDGKLNKPFWKHAPWTDHFVDIEGDSKPRPRFQTRVKMLWDDTYLYVGAELQEPHVWATLTEHDSVIFHDNDFEMFIDPDGDNHDYYELEINALNTTWDLRLVKPYRDGGPALNEWEIPGFRSAVHVDGTLNDPRDMDKEWSLEMVLPWKALGEYANRPSPPNQGDQWRINFSRVEWDIEVNEKITEKKIDEKKIAEKKIAEKITGKQVGSQTGGDKSSTQVKYKKVPDRLEHNWVWSPQGVIDMHRPEKWGYVQFSTKPPGTDHYMPDPAIPARDLLMQVYYAQKEFHKAHGRWAASWDDLGLALPHDSALPTTPTFELTTSGYRATCICRLHDGSLQNWHVREDSRLWRE